jgi:8-amino-7-oxononanoate synthase
MRPHPLAWIDGALDELECAGLRRRLAIRSGAQTARVVFDGKELINFGSNDYLGLAADERVIAAARQAAEREGWGSGASPLVSGRSESHALLENRLAEFEGVEASLVFPSGFAANAGIIPAIVDEADVIFADEKNHASLIDGCRLSKARRFVYPHRDCVALEKMLRETGGFRRRLIVTDTLFSMDGDLAPVARLAELAQQFDAMLMVDEAHATGVFGVNGQGIVDQVFHSKSQAAPGFAGGSESPEYHDTGETPGGAGGCRIDDGVKVIPLIRVGTLSKALGSGGGFVCGAKLLIDWLANRARSYVFSTAQPPAVCAAAIAALEIVQHEPQRREKLLRNAAGLRRTLGEQGWHTGSSESQIIPIITSDANCTMRFAASLRDAGFFVPGIRPPSVPEGQSLLRLSLCYHHTPEMIGDLTIALAKLR